MDRHARQSKLAEIGPAGQARIARARVDVGLDGVAAEVAARYLAGAGVGGLRVPSEDAAASARAVDASVPVEVSAAIAVACEPAALAVLRDPSARALGLGALVALEALRSAL
jgi:hypothetical protein